MPTSELVFLLIPAAILFVFANGARVRNSRKGFGSGLSNVQFVSSRRLLSPAERAAFIDLAKVLAKRGYVCPKVRIADLITVRSKSRSAWQTAFNKIACKHVDFAVMSKGGDILFAVEIDDRSHQRADRKKRDRLVNEVFAEAGVPLLRAAPGKLQASEQLAAIVERFWPEAPLRHEASERSPGRNQAAS